MGKKVKAHKEHAPLAISVIGTDTGVGKTIISAGLARTFSKMGMKVGVFKPFAADPAVRSTGEGFSTDADLLARAVNMEGGAEAACGQLLAAPLSPLAAAELEGKEVDIDHALDQAHHIINRHEITVIEGCGGWLVPLTDQYTTADFFAELHVPVIVVARSGLGTLNHTMLTLSSIWQSKLDVLGVVLNRSREGPLDKAEKTNPGILKKFTKLPVWGPVEYKPRLHRDELDRVEIEDLHELTGIAKDICKVLKKA